MNGIYDEMIPVRNSYWLSANLPNAVLIAYPRLGPRLFVSVSQPLRAAGRGIPSLGFDFCALLSPPAFRGAGSFVLVGDPGGQQFLWARPPVG